MTWINVLYDAFFTFIYARFPNLKSVRELILKRGQGKVDKRKIPLTDNTVIEQHLGKLWWIWVLVIVVMPFCEVSFIQHCIYTWFVLSFPAGVNVIVWGLHKKQWEYICLNIQNKRTHSACSSSFLYTVNSKNLMLTWPPLSPSSHFSWRSLYYM